MKSENDTDSPLALQHDADLQIAVGSNRHSKQWHNRTMRLSEFIGRLYSPQRTGETVEQYQALPKGQQDDVKDVGGFVGGLLKGGRRSKDAVQSRSILTLDADYPDAAFLDQVERVLGAAAHTVYSTHKHTPEKPRYRLIVYTDRVMSTDEYQAAMRMLAHQIGIDQFDDSTYDINRLMYWPSVSSDGVYYCEHNDAPPVGVDRLLAQYGSDDAWRDVTLWPTSSRESQIVDRKLRRQQNPKEKSGVVGAWCRSVSIHDAIQMTGAYRYERADRYTYIDGSTTSGLVVYNDLYAYSNHGTDPAMGQLCNAFDLVRIHQYGSLDDDAKEGTPINRLPSYQAMAEHAKQRNDVRGELVASTINVNDFENLDADIDQGESGSADGQTQEWFSRLQIADNGLIKPTFVNAVEIINNDPAINRAMAYNQLKMRVERSADGELWSATDSYTIREHIGRTYQVDFPEAKIEQAIEYRADALAYHPIKDYLQSVDWDGESRIDGLFTNWLGADDTFYIREASRCWMLAAIYRVFHPGFKFDHAPVLTGDQGIGKTTFIQIMAHYQWYAELSTFDPKQAMEEINGAWLVEINEMGAANKSELEQQKSFLSGTSTTTRPAYARHPVEYKRQCVFIGTTNEHEFLKDSTGNRRWWPVQCGAQMVRMDDLKQLVNQLWAEAYTRYVLGETPVMDDEAVTAAKIEQAERLEADDWEGRILEWLDQQAMTDRYDNGFSDEAGSQFEDRRRVCVAEILEDCLHIPVAQHRRNDKMRVSRIMDRADNWQRISTGRFGDRFGRQRGWIRVDAAPF